MGRHLHTVLTTIAIALGILASTRPARAEDLDQAFHKQAPRVLKALQDKGYKNVGVLKFRVKKGNEPVSDNVGTLNLSLANKLEIALAMANDNDPAKQVGIIQHASGIAARVKGANHLFKEGRGQLFDETYPLAWGNQQVKPDAFLMGAAKVSPDLREMTVNVMAFERETDPVQIIQPFTIATDSSLLTEMGESFTLRGAFNGGVKVTADKAIESAVKVSKKEEDYPTQDKTAPVTLEVFYDGKAVPFDLKNGRAFIREPRQGQKVTFVVRRNGNGNERYGVVLKVNGENVLFNERHADAQCHKLVVGPSSAAITVRGFQTGNNVVKEFVVLSHQASKQNEMYYGADVGTISMVVFPEKPASSVTPPYTDEGEDIAAITRGVFPEQRPQNLGALKAQLRAAGTQEESRGIIVAGKETAGTVQRTNFKAEPTPILSAVITYYKPQ